MKLPLATIRTPFAVPNWDRHTVVLCGEPAIFV